MLVNRISQKLLLNEPISRNWSVILFLHRIGLRDTESMR